MLKAGLSDNANVKFMLADGKDHNPNYSDNALKLLLKFTKARAKLLKKKNLTKEDKANFVTSFNWDKMTEQDEAVWDAIFAHLDS